jgi:hypothetical protein
MQIRATGLDRLKSEIKQSLRDTVSRLSEEVLAAARAKTPIKSGNARKNWKKSVSDDTFVVENRVPYIERLEAGASKQAPRGIIGPTLSQIKGKLR